MESELIGTYKGWHVSECTVYRARKSGKVVWASSINGIKHEINTANKQVQTEHPAPAPVQQPVQQVQQPKPAPKKKMVVKPKQNVKAKKVAVKPKTVQKTLVEKPAPVESVQTESVESDTYQ